MNPNNEEYLSLMGVPKTPRVENRALLDQVKAKGCMINNAECCGPCDPDHTKTKGSGGGDTDDNIGNLCRWHHVKRHKTGRWAMIRDYFVYAEFLVNNGHDYIIHKAISATPFRDLPKVRINLNKAGYIEG